MKTPSDKPKYKREPRSSQSYSPALLTQYRAEIAAWQISRDDVPDDDENPKDMIFELDHTTGFYTGQVKFVNGGHAALFKTFLRNLIKDSK